jgi:hypothetical protein
MPPAKPLDIEGTEKHCILDFRQRSHELPMSSRLLLSQILAGQLPAFTGLVLAAARQIHAN